MVCISDELAEFEARFGPNARSGGLSSIARGSAARARALPRRAEFPLTRCLRHRRRCRAPDRSFDGVDHLLLHDLVLVDREVPDTGHRLHVDILQRTAKIPGPRHGLADAAGDVEIDVALSVTRQPGAEHRVEAYRQLDRDPKLANP